MVKKKVVISLLGLFAGAHLLALPSAWPCEVDQNANSPVSGEALETISSSAQAAATVPDPSAQPPAKKPAIKTKKLILRVIVKAGVQPSNPDTGVSNIVTPLDKAVVSSDPVISGPAQADQKTGDDMFVELISSDPSSPQTSQQANAYLAQNQGVSNDAKFFFLNYAGNQDSANWGHGPNKHQTLDQDFTGFKLGNGTAGECRDQSVQDAGWEASLGFKHTGTLTTNWDGGHVVSYFQNPDQIQYIFKNYYNQSLAPSKSLSKAAMEESRQLSPLSLADTVETGTNTSHVQQFQLQNPRAKYLVANLYKISDGENGPAEALVELGTLEDNASVEKFIYSNKIVKVNTFAGIGQNNEEGRFYHAEGGVRADSNVSRNLTDKTSLDLKSENILGYIAVRDYAGPGNDWNTPGAARLAQGAILTLHDQAQVTRKTASDHEMSAGVSATGEEVLYDAFSGKASAGSPHNDIVFNGSITRGPVKVDGSFDSFIWVRQANEAPTSLGVHPLSTSVGVSVDKKLDDGQFVVSNKVTGYSFGNPADGDTGLRDTLSLKYKTGNQWKLVLDADTAKVFNHSGNALIQSPFFITVDGGAEKEFLHGTLKITGYTNGDNDRVFYLMGDHDPSAALNKPRAGGSANWTF